VEVAPPVDVIAQELDDQAFEQGVVLAIGAEEAGIERALLGVGDRRGEAGRKVGRGHALRLRHQALSPPDSGQPRASQCLGRV